MFRTCVYFCKKSWANVRNNREERRDERWVRYTCVPTMHRDERRGGMRWEYREERRQRLKKSWSGGSEQSPKKLISEFNFITEVPSKTSVCCLKSTPATFQKMLFKHGFWSNNFQTILFWTPWPNTFFQILDTSVQCLNTEHCVLKRQAKWPLIHLAQVRPFHFKFDKKNSL